MFTVGQDLKIDLADMDYQSWEKQLVADKYVFTELLDVVNRITTEHDTKMATLQELIFKKIDNPINKGNKKVIIFTAFSDTAEYLYK